MRERLRQNGGGLEILSNHQGTTIIATVPLQAEKTDPRDGR
jgi:signal transduction histidine kinase